MKYATKKIISLRLSEKVLVSSYYIDFSKSDNKDAIIKEMVNQIKENPNFVLGDFKDEKSLAISLKRKVFGDTKTFALKSIIPSVEETTKIYNEAFIKSFNALPINGNIDIYILPMCNEGASKDLGGVNGFVVDGVNVFYLLIDIKNPKWRTSLTETVPHEYAHMVYTSKFEWNSILDGMVNEGLAEHFREYITGGNQAPWSIALKKSDALRELNKLPKTLLNKFIDESNVDLYISYFFGTTKDIPNWYGYSLGYWLIDEIMDKNNITLIELFEKNPKEILELFKQ